MPKVTDIFATRADLLAMLAEVESAQPIHYAEAGMQDKPEPLIYGSASEIPSLGTTRLAETNLGKLYLVAYAGTPFMVESVPQRRGGTRYAVDQRKNPDSVVLIHGGQIDERTILAGSIGTCTESAQSVVLLRIITSSIRRKWSEIKSYAVGPEALEILDAGGRLTANLRSPREYDLQR